MEPPCTVLLEGLLDPPRVLQHLLPMRPPRANRRRHLPPPARRLIPPLPGRLLHLVRLLFLACALQLSGSPHVLIDLIAGADAGCIETCSSPCESEEDDHDCPPGCPNCSCPHGRLPSLPPSLVPVLPEQLAWELPEPWTPYRSGLPPAPSAPRLDRPPRA